MGEVRTPEAFTKVERELHALTSEFASEMTQRVLSAVCADKERRRQALAAVREVAATRGIEMRTEKARETPIRTLGGHVIRVRSPSASAVPRGGLRRSRGASGTGVHYVLDELGIRDRSTPAFQRKTIDPKAPLAGRHVVASIDGGRLNTRRRTGGAWTKGGRRNFETNWREPKVLSIYMVDEDGKRDKTDPAPFQWTTC